MFAYSSVLMWLDARDRVAAVPGPESVAAAAFYHLGLKVGFAAGFGSLVLVFLYRNVAALMGWGRVGRAARLVRKLALAEMRRPKTKKFGGDDELEDGLWDWA